METFGASAPAGALYKHFGFTPERVADAGRAAVKRARSSEPARPKGPTMSTITELNPRLMALTEAGVSVWLDQIRRSLVEGGELARMVAEESLRGVTSNPSIFEKAILGSTDYDEELEALAAREPRRAGDLRATSRSATCSSPPTCSPTCIAETGGRDGFVSLEVAPDLAHDTEGTLEQARSYWQRVDRANVMIKIPGTPEGVPAIEQAIYEGINVNVTLLFSVAAYEAVAEAYIRGARAPPRRGHVARRQLGRVVLRLARGHERRPAARAARPDRSGRDGGARQRARGVPPLQGALLGPRWERAGGGRRGRPAAAVGLDRRQEPALPGHDVRRRAGRAAHRQHDAAADAAGGRRPRLGDRADGRAGPDGGSGGAGRRRASTSTRSPTSCWSTASSSSRRR